MADFMVADFFKMCNQLDSNRTNVDKYTFQVTFFDSLTNQYRTLKVIDIDFSYSEKLITLQAEED